MNCWLLLLLLLLRTTFNYICSGIRLWKLHFAHLGPPPLYM
jgi:hypothetical protein